MKRYADNASRVLRLLSHRALAGGAVDITGLVPSFHHPLRRAGSGLSSAAHAWWWLAR